MFFWHCFVLRTSKCYMLQSYFVTVRHINCKIDLYCTIQITQLFCKILWQFTYHDQALCMTNPSIPDPWNVKLFREWSTAFLGCRDLQEYNGTRLHWWFLKMLRNHRCCVFLTKRLTRNKTHLEQTLTDESTCI